MGDNHIISIRFSLQGYLAGMAHPYHIHKSITFDLDDNQQIDLSDLFQSDSNYLDVIANYAHANLAKHLRDKQMVEKQAPRPLLIIIVFGILNRMDCYSRLMNIK